MGTEVAKAVRFALNILNQFQNTEVIQGPQRLMDSGIAPLGPRRIADYESIILRDNTKRVTSLVA
jgi:hypothetical protein